MTIINLNYDVADVNDSFEPLPHGTYAAKIAAPDDCTLVKSSTNKDMLKIAWTIVDGEYEGRKLFDNVVLSVDWKVKQYANVIGLESGSELDTQDFVGAEALLTVEQREYQGEIRNQIKTIKAS